MMMCPLLFCSSFLVSKMQYNFKQLFLMTTEQTDNNALIIIKILFSERSYYEFITTKLPKVNLLFNLIK